MPTLHGRAIRRERAAAERRQRDRRRGTARQRGYDYKWEVYARKYLEHPDNVLCRRCSRQGVTTLAVLVDHIVPVTGPDDPRFHDPTNHQPLCSPCHRVKTAEDMRKGLTRR